MRDMIVEVLEEERTLEEVETREEFRTLEVERALEEVGEPEICGKTPE